MKYLIIFMICFLIIYLIYLLTVVLRKNKYEKYLNGKQIQFFVKKYNLDFNKIDKGKFINILSIINSIIISLTVTIIIVINNFILKFLIAFIILIFLILIFYSVIGICIKKKEGK